MEVDENSKQDDTLRAKSEDKLQVLSTKTGAPTDVNQEKCCGDKYNHVSINMENHIGLIVLISHHNLEKPRNGRGVSGKKGSSQINPLIVLIFYQDQVSKHETRKFPWYTDQERLFDDKLDSSIHNDGGCWLTPPISMSCIAWHARGLGNQRAFIELKRLVAEKRPSLFFLAETKMRDYQTIGGKNCWDLMFCLL